MVSFKKFFFGFLIMCCVSLLALSSCAAEDCILNSTVNDTVDYSSIRLPSDFNDSNFYNVNNSNDFYNLMKKLDSPNRGNGNVVVINLTNGTYHFDNEEDVLFNFRWGNLIIYGNGASFSSKGDGTFLKIGSQASFYCINCTFTDSKPAIRNYGSCNLIYCSFIKNKRANTINAHGLMRYGGAIDNYKTLNCINCNFTDNRGSYGGAVCGEDNSINIFTDCLWGNNEGGHGEDLFLFNSATAYVFHNNTNKVPLYDGFTTSSVHVLNLSNNFTDKFINIRSENDLYTAFFLLNTGFYNFTDVTLNLTSNKTYKVNCEDCSNAWESLLHDLHDGVVEGLLDFLYLRQVGTGLWSWVKSLVVEERADEAAVYKTDDNVLCWIKAGLNVYINGNGATLAMRDYDGAINEDVEDFHLFFVASSSYLTLNNVSICNFNSAIINKGNLNCINTTFEDNLINYIVSGRDIGGAIRNYGTLQVSDCVFKSNHANRGGAIYNEGVANIYDSTFNDNKAALVFKGQDCHIPLLDDMPLVNWATAIAKYSFTVIRHAFSKDCENDVYTSGNGLTYVVNSNVVNLCDGNGVFIKRDALGYIVRNFTVTSESELINVINAVNKDSRTDVFNITLSGIKFNVENAFSNLNDDGFSKKQLMDNINFLNDYVNLNMLSITSSVAEYTLNENQYFNLKYGTLIINGNGAIISSSNDNHFINCSRYSEVYINNLTVRGFNTAIVNEGNCIFQYCNFNDNKVNYIVDRDYAGVVDNKGVCRFINCSFIGNSAKYGGVTFNEGSCLFIECYFNDNTGYDGVGIYDTGLGISWFIFSNNSTCTGSYQLDTGLSNNVNCIFTYTLNWLPAVCFVTGVGAGFAGAGFVGSTLIVGTAVGVSVTMNAIRDVHNHDVHLGEFIIHSISDAVNYVMLYYLGYRVGTYYKGIYDAYKDNLAYKNMQDAVNMENGVNEEDLAYKNMQDAVNMENGVNEEDLAYKNMQDALNKKLDDFIESYGKVCKEDLYSIDYQIQSDLKINSALSNKIKYFKTKIMDIKFKKKLLDQSLEIELDKFLNDMNNLKKPINFAEATKTNPTIQELCDLKNSIENKLEGNLNIIDTSTDCITSEQFSILADDVCRDYQYTHSEIELYNERMISPSLVSAEIDRVLAKNMRKFITNPSVVISSNSELLNWVNSCLRIYEYIEKWNIFINEVRSVNPYLGL